MDCAEVLDIELERGGNSYTVDTVDALRSRYPDAEMFLLMGTDMFLTLEKWREADRLLNMSDEDIRATRNDAYDIVRRRKGFISFADAIENARYDPESDE